jgi:uncharacterized membrane-anchored protein
MRRTFHVIRACVAAAWVSLGAAGALAQPSTPSADVAPDAPDASADALAIAPLTEEEAAAARAEFEASLHHQKGKLSLPGTSVTLNVPDAFYFLSSLDTQKVLEEAWGNPPDSNVTGMLFPEGMSPLDEDAWGVVLTFEKSGYVSDEDASGIDYDMLIDTMRDGLDQENVTRKAQGYPTIDIVGWAAKPRYDANTHKLYWAKEIAFSSAPENTLNYDMRVLGRYGVLSLNFIASVSQLAQIEAAAPAVLRIADFDAGSRYQDFNASTDTKADYGVVGLIGGTAAAAALAKNGGIIAALLLFLKKGLVFIIAGFGALVAGIRALLNRKPKSQVKTEQRAATAFFDGPAAEDPPVESVADKPPPSSPAV